VFSVLLTISSFKM